MWSPLAIPMDFSRFVSAGSPPTNLLDYSSILIYLSLLPISKATKTSPNNKNYLRWFVLDNFRLANLILNLSPLENKLKIKVQGPI
jgi:hypothetical protein